jgi:hypothetical protein
VIHVPPDYHYYTMYHYQQRQPAPLPYSSQSQAQRNGHAEGTFPINQTAEVIAVHTPELPQTTYIGH